MSYRESLVEVLRQVDPKIGIEVGVHKGALSKHLLNSFPDLFLYLIDPYITHKEYPDQERNKQKAISSLSGMNCRFVFEASEKASIIDFPKADFVFIDADHSEESVYQDMNLWWPHVKYGGIFCGHDFGKDDIPGVTVAVERWFRERDLSFDVAEGNIWLVVK